MGFLKQIICLYFLVVATIASAKPLAVSYTQVQYIGNVKIDRFTLTSDTLLSGKTYKFLIQGGLHGNERETTKFVQWLSKKMASGQSSLSLLPAENVVLDFLPIANPSGVKSLSRYNDRGVNLNRNFPTLWGLTKEYPGAAPFSEAESQALRSLFIKEKYTGAVDVHGYVNWVVGPSPLKERANRTQEYSAWTSLLKKETSKLGDYEYKTGLELGDGGAFEDWAFWEQKAFAFCLEMSSAFRYTRDKEDSWAIYEKFILQMFTHAISLSDDRAPGYAHTQGTLPDLPSKLN